MSSLNGYADKLRTKPEYIFKYLVLFLFVLHWTTSHTQIYVAAETSYSSFRYGNGVLQASGLAQHGAAVVSIPDQTELWSSEGAGRPC